MLINQSGPQAERKAVKCLRKCEDRTLGTLWKMNLRDRKESLSIFNMAMAEFILQVRMEKFELREQTMICTYITEIAKRKWWSLSKKKNRETSLEYIPADDSSEKGQDHDHLHRALALLSAADRDILIAFYFYDTSLYHYAKKANISYDAAKKRLSRARKKLKNTLKTIEE
ncbi:MAG: sigma-70 family RNA polymerase sigma factor [Saprospiraceae bacterium]|nr:sigma-70 family RNA polymerase sigma factor [Saprospiraceae bacterium]